MTTDKISKKQTAAAVMMTGGELHALTMRASELRAAYVRSLWPAAKRGVAALFRAIARDRLRHPAAV